MLRKIYTFFCVCALSLYTPVHAEDTENPMFSIAVLLMEQSIRTQQQYIRTQQQYIRTLYQNIRTQRQWANKARMWIETTDEDTTHIKQQLIQHMDKLNNLQQWEYVQNEDIQKVQGMITENKNSLKDIKLGLVNVTQDMINVLITEIATFEKRIQTQEINIHNLEQGILQVDENIEVLTQKIMH